MNLRLGRNRRSPKSSREKEAFKRPDQARCAASKPFRRKHAGIASAAGLAGRHRDRSSYGSTKDPLRVPPLCGRYRPWSYEAAALRRCSIEVPSTPALVARFAKVLEGLDELRAAIRITRVIESIHSDEDVGLPRSLPRKPMRAKGKSCCEREHKSRVFRRPVSASFRSFGTSIESVSAEPPKLADPS